MRQTVHAAHRWETRDAYRVLVGKFEEKKTTLKMYTHMAG
jgi:hypothetical protein